MTVSRTQWVTVLVFGTLAVMGGIVLLVFAPDDNHADNQDAVLGDTASIALDQQVPVEDQRALLAFSPESVQSLRVTRDGQEVLLQRSVEQNAEHDSRWYVLVSDGTVAARSEKIEDILAQLQSLISTGGIVRDVPQEEWSEFGLDEAQRISVEIELDDGSNRYVNIGNVDFQGVYAYAHNERMSETELALIPVAIRSFLLIDAESIQQGTGEPRVEE